MGPPRVAGAALIPAPAKLCPSSPAPTEANPIAVTALIAPAAAPPSPAPMASPTLNALQGFPQLV